MNIVRHRMLGSRIATCAFAVATLAVGAALQGCGAAPDPEPTGKSAQDLSVIGIPIPSPTVSVGIGDAGITLAPIDTIGALLPPEGVTVDPIGTVNDLLGALSQPISVGVTAPGVQIGLNAGLNLPKLPNPFDGGIPIIQP